MWSAATSKSSRWSTSKSRILVCTSSLLVVLDSWQAVEYRDESFSDIRDPRLNGAIPFVDSAGVTFPYVSDIMNSSPSASSFGDRQVTSVFTELAVPVLDNLDVQLALRYEDFSDVGSTTVGKVAFGYRVIAPVLIRGSWSEAFRAPNLVTINEALVARSNTTNDPSCLYVDPTESVLDCSYGVQRTAQGSALLQPETSDNTSIGLVIEPIDGLTLTYDRWRIEKDNTIGLFGEENHVALDLLRRLGAGASNCSAVTTNPAVIRDTAINQDALPLFAAAGLCPLVTLRGSKTITQTSIRVPSKAMTSASTTKSIRHLARSA